MLSFRLAARSAALFLVPTLAIAQGSPVRAFTGFTLIDGTDRAPYLTRRSSCAMDASSPPGLPGRSTFRMGRSGCRSPARPSSPASSTRTDTSTRPPISAPTPPTASRPSSALVASRRQCSRRGPSRIDRRARSGRVCSRRAGARAQDTRRSARRRSRTMPPRKSDIVKIRVDDNLGTTPKMTPEVYRAVIDEAHKRGMRVADTPLLPRRREVAARGGVRLHRAQHPRCRRRRGRSSARSRQRDVCLQSNAHARGLDVRLRVDARRSSPTRSSSRTRIASG